MMKLSPAILGAAAAAAAVIIAVAQADDACCSTDADCVDLQSSEQLEYNNRFGKTLVCDMECPGKLNCNMFGLCDFCRGCFTTCDGVITYLDETNASEDSIIFCPTGEVEELSECSGLGSASGSGTGSSSGSGTGSASGSGTGSASGSGTGSASGSGMGSASGSGTGSASGRGSGSASGSGMGSASGSGTGSASGSGTGSASGSGMGSASGSGSGSASGSGMGSASGSGSGSASGSGTGSASGSGSGSSSGTGTGSASGSASNRIADIPGCTCGDDELDDATTAFFCDFGKSMYCDVECVDGSDPEDRLFPEMGGLWCKPFGYEGCRLCMLDCTDYDGDYCVPCPEGVKDWCEA